MFNALLHKIALWLTIPYVALFTAGGYTLPQTVSMPSDSLSIQNIEQRLSSLESQSSQNLGASNPLPTSVAIFATSLQSAITSTQTTMNLVSATYNNGASTLASSTYDFIIDEGTASSEFVSADCTGTVCTNMQRGLDWITGTSTVANLQFLHRRGASVKITDAPILLKLSNLAQGTMNYPVPIRYDPSVSTTSQASNRNNFASAGLVADTAFSSAGIINASTLAKGVVQIATPLQIASSTAICASTAPCVISADNATSTYQIATAPLKVVVTGNNGQIDQNFLPASTTRPVSFATSTTYIGNFPAYQIGTNRQIFTGLASSTFIVPSGISLVHVQMIGGGGGGGGSNASSASCGGGAGAYFDGFVNVTSTTSILVTVGYGGGGGTNSPTPGLPGGASYFGPLGYFATSTGGLGGGINVCSAPGTGGATSTPTSWVSGSFNVPGGDGIANIANSPSGASSFFGANTLSTQSIVYGTGGNGRGNSGVGASGAPGIVIVTW